MNFTPAEFDRSKDLEISSSDQQKLNQLKFLETLDWDYECAVLKSGSSAGEQALLGYGIRLVTLKCQTNCYLAELHRDDF